VSEVRHCFHEGYYMHEKNMMDPVSDFGVIPNYFHKENYMR
jgi:hypothetical protein